MLVCVLRIGGIDLEHNETIRMLSVPPYRKDNKEQAGLNCDMFHYDVGDAASKQELLSEILRFLHSEEEALLHLLTDKNITMREIDVGITMPVTFLSSSLRLNGELIESLARFKLSFSMSVYQSSHEVDVTQLN